MARAPLLLCLLCLCLLGALLNQVDCIHLLQVLEPRGSAGGCRDPLGPALGFAPCQPPKPPVGPGDSPAAGKGAAQVFHLKRFTWPKACAVCTCSIFAKMRCFVFFFRLKKEVSHAHPVLKITASVTSTDKKRCFRCGNPLLLR